MVDGGAALRASAVTGWTRREPDMLTVDVQPAGEAVLAAYGAMAREAVAGVPQSAEWVSAWIAATDARMIFIDIGQDGRRIMTLALEVVDTGGCRVARFPGGRHAIGNFPATTHQAGAIDPSMHLPMPAFVHRIAELDLARPVVVYCQGGYRSSIAASVLRRAGAADVSDLIGGYAAWERHQRPAGVT
jgi:rhodanese-related sulfurtransferase